MTSVAIVHDYLTQRGGAERVVLELAAAFPDASIYTSLYEPDATFDGFRSLDVRTGPLDRSRLLRRHHRLALPFLARSFDSMSVDADVVLCSSSGWAHGVRTSGCKVVYCYTPARWLYQPERYLRGPLPRLALKALAPRLRGWDARAAASADNYLAISTVVAERIRDAYGRKAEIVFPPVAVDVGGPEAEVAGLEPGFALCVSRLLPYKNVDAVISAARHLDARLVVAGDGPLYRELRLVAPANVHLLGGVDEPELRWLYRHSAVVVTASYEDFGLVPVEAAAFGIPVVALRWGGHLDTVIEGETGLFFNAPEAESIASAVESALGFSWDKGRIEAHAEEFSAERFQARMHQLMAGVR